jgi:hypothetical protein
MHTIQPAVAIYSLQVGPSNSSWTLHAEVCTTFVQTIDRQARLIGMKRSKAWRNLAIAAALLCALASVKVMAKPSIRRPVVQFIHFYEQSQGPGEAQDLSLWDRVLYSVLMARSS